LASQETVQRSTSAQHPRIHCPLREDVPMHQIGRTTPRSFQSAYQFTKEDRGRVKHDQVARILLEPIASFLPDVCRKTALPPQSEHLRSRLQVTGLYPQHGDAIFFAQAKVTLNRVARCSDRNLVATSGEFQRKVAHHYCGRRRTWRVIYNDQ